MEVANFKHFREIVTPDESVKVRLLLRMILMLHLLAAMLMVISISSPHWYSVHLLYPYTDKMMGHLGIFQHCSMEKDTCWGREGVLGFTDSLWPYRPLKSRDFDLALLMFIITMAFEFLAILFTIMSCCNFYNRLVILTLLLSSTVSAICGVTGVSYLGGNVKSEKFHISWTSYVTWFLRGMACCFVFGNSEYTSCLFVLYTFASRDVT